MSGSRPKRLAGLCSSARVVHPDNNPADMKNPGAQFVRCVDLFHRDPFRRASAWPMCTACPTTPDPQPLSTHAPQISSYDAVMLADDDLQMSAADIEMVGSGQAQATACLWLHRSSNSAPCRPSPMRMSRRQPLAPRPHTNFSACRRSKSSSGTTSIWPSCPSAGEHLLLLSPCQRADPGSERCADEHAAMLPPLCLPGATDRPQPGT